MIARVWRGITKVEKADEYYDYLLRTGVKDCRQTAGNREVQILRQVGEAQAEFLFISFWDSLESIRRFAGEDIERAVYYPEDKDYLITLEPKVTHYEVLHTSSNEGRAS